MKKMAVFILLCLISGNMFAFTLLGNNVKHTNSEITINISNNDCDQSGYTASEILDFTVDAVDRFWNSAATSSIELKRGGITIDDLGTATSSQVMAAAENNTILIACSDGTSYATNPFSSGWTGGIGGMSVSGSLTKGGLILNNFTANKLSSMTNDQLLALIAHELGHAIGIHHSADPVALMYYTLDGKQQLKLTQDDVDGVTYLYPNEKELGGLAGSCGTIAPISGGGPGTMLPTVLLGMLFAIMLSKLLSSRDRGIRFLK